MYQPRWELLYDMTCAGEAGMVRLMLEVASIKYTDVRLDKVEPCKGISSDNSNKIAKTSEPSTNNNTSKRASESMCRKETYHLRSGDNSDTVSAGSKTSSAQKGKRSKRKNPSGSDGGSQLGRASGVQPKDGVGEAGNQEPGGSEAGNQRGGGETAEPATTVKRTRLLTDDTRLPYPRLPMIKKGTIELSHVVTILKYLGEESGLFPKSLDDRLMADQIVQYCWDYWTEGRFAVGGNAFDKPVSPLGHFDDDRMPYVDVFTKERMPMWMSFFENCLKKTMNGKKYLFGKSLCYADVALYHILDVTNNCFPTAWNKAIYMPLLSFYFNRIRSTSRVAKYILSHRYLNHGFTFDACHHVRL